MDATGDLITESLRDYTRKQVTSAYSDLDDFLKNWSAAEKKSVLIEQLEDQGVFFDALAELVGRDYDAFDLVCHIAYGQKPLTRKERANNVKKRDVFTKYGEQARAVLSALLDKYTNQGLAVIEKMDVLKVDPLDELGTPIEIVNFFGGKGSYLKAIAELESLLYQSAA
jgi:type I restriction enzyme R subunit